MKSTDWLICDMDEGLLRVEPTRTAAVAWCTEFFDGKVLERYTYGPGSYAYSFGLPGDDYTDSAFIGLPEWAKHHGHDLDQAPLYPLADKPFERVER